MAGDEALAVEELRDDAPGNDVDCKQPQPEHDRERDSGLDDLEGDERGEPEDGQGDTSSTATRSPNRFVKCSTARTGGPDGRAVLAFIPSSCQGRVRNSRFSGPRWGAHSMRLAPAKRR